MWKYVFGFIFIALAWAVVLVFDEYVPMWPAIAVTAFIVLLLVGLAIWRRVRARNVAREIERGLASQAREFEGQVRPEMRAEIQTMQSEFEKALNALKTSKMARSGRDALGALPWYMIIGPPGAGKSTALRNSGIKFPYLGSKGGAVRGVGGTRNCDWWLTNEAILLDTAGRYTTEDDDHDEWLAFLDMLKRARPKKPVNGILVAVSIGDLGGAHDDDVLTLAKGVRERVDEVMSRLDMVMPVYVLFTKCDLIPGFVETFSDLNKHDRGQVWGFTLPASTDAGERATIFDESIEELASIVQERSLLRMGEERRVEVREKIFEFPQQFAALRPQLADFVTQVFAENPYQETPLLRGVYFTSGTQEGRPIDRVMQKMAEGFGIRPRMAAGAPPTEAKSYFLREVFSRIVFPDGGLAVRSSKSLRRERVVRWGVTAAAITGAAGIALLPASAYNANRQLNQEVRALVDALVDSTATKGEPAASSALAAVAPTARKLLEYQTAGPPVAMRYGMYQGSKLLDTVTIATRDYLVVPVLKADARGVAVASRGAKIGGAQVAQLLDALQLHLLLTAPKAEEEPKPEDRAWDKDWSRWIRDHLVAHWSERAKADKDGSSAKTLEALAEFYARRLIDDPDLLPERDDVTVVTARRLINSAGREDPVTRVVSDPELKQFDLSLTAMLGGAATSFTSDPVVRGGFTRAAWDAGIKERLETDEDQGTSWVTRKQGSSSELPPEEKQRRVAEYFRRYVDEWTKFLIAVQPKVPSDLPEAQTLISRLTGDRAYESLWHAVNENVRLDNGTAQEAAAIVEKKLLDPIKKKFKLGAKGQQAANAKLAGLRGKLSGPDEVEKHFDTFLKFGPSEQPGVKSALESYLDQLRTVGIAIKVYLETQEAKPFRSAVQGAKFEIEDLISRYRDNGWDSVLRKLLLPPLQATEEAVAGAGASAANRNWCEAVVTPFETLLAKRYPFKRDGVDAPLPEVEKFFQPDKGTLWKYYSESLKSDIETDGKSFRLLPNAAVKYTAKLTAFLARAQQLTDALFADAGGKIGMPVDVRIWPASTIEGGNAANLVSKIVFEIGGQKPVTYQNWKESWVRTGFPGRGAKLRVSTTKGEVEEIAREGDWGLFRLLDEAKQNRQVDTEEYLTAVWPLASTQARIRVDFRPTSLSRPFSGFDVPHNVAPGSSPCGK